MTVASEGDERFTVVMFTPEGEIPHTHSVERARMTVTIQDNEPPPSPGTAGLGRHLPLGHEEEERDGNRVDGQRRPRLSSRQLALELQAGDRWP